MTSTLSFISKSLFDLSINDDFCCFKMRLFFTYKIFALTPPPSPQTNLLAMFLLCAITTF